MSKRKLKRQLGLAQIVMLGLPARSARKFLS